MESTAIRHEAASFFRRKELPGVEVRIVAHSGGPWHCYSTDQEFVTSQGFRGELWHRRQRLQFAPGKVLCSQPGEVFSARQVTAPGACSSLMIEDTTLQSYAAELGLGTAPLRFAALSTPSVELAERLCNLLLLVRSDCSALQLQSAMVAFMSSATAELLETQIESVPSSDSDAEAARRVRECLHNDPAGSVDLSTLAKETGMSRFRALRVFKRRYGLPPHSYQLRVRLSLAQKSLRAGLEPAQVAAEFGFVDQSHLTRHFKKLLGVTPARYARGAQLAPMELLTGT